MEYTTKSQIITETILNKKTGEFEKKEFEEIKKTKIIKGGFNMIYHKTYEQVMEDSIKSNKDLKLFNWITNRFTYQRVESSIVYSECDLDISQPSFSKMIKLLIELGYIMRISRGIYRLNPFIYVPYRADGAELQREWNLLSKSTE